MAEETDEQSSVEAKSKLPMIIIAAVACVAIAAILIVMGSDNTPEVEVQVPPAEYVVEDKMYQLKDGAYLRLSFSIVVSADKVEKLKEIIEKKAPGRLPNGVNMVVANKTRDELISGTHKRQAFARELKKMVEERVLADHNRRQLSAEDTIRVEEILIANFVTQGGV